MYLPTSLTCLHISLISLPTYPLIYLPTHPLMYLPTNNIGLPTHISTYQPTYQPIYVPTYSTYSMTYLPNLNYLPSLYLPTYIFTHVPAYPPRSSLTVPVLLMLFLLLAGQIDSSVEVKINRNPNIMKKNPSVNQTCVVPLELKTGKCYTKLGITKTSL